MTDDRTRAEGARQLLRHTVATLAYRAAKVLRDFPADAANARVSPTTRTPLEVLSHLGDLMAWGARFARGERGWATEPAPDWPSAADRFFREVADLDAALAAATDPGPWERIFQGPIADALTHVGQLAMLRGMLGASVRPESYARAEIQAGRVGREQAPARAEFDGDASRPKVD